MRRRVTDRFEPFLARLRRVAVGLAWGIVLTLIAFGSAGLATATAHPPAGGGRPELTWAGDEAVRPHLDAATADLAAIAADVERLGLLGRGALAALAGSDFDLLDETVAEGSLLVIGIRDAATQLRSDLTGLPGMGVNAELTVSAATVERRQRIADAATLTEGMAEGWAELAEGGAGAARLSHLLTRHDELVLTAIESGLDRDFEGAAAALDEATAQLQTAQELRDRLANTVDVATLDEWLRRNRDYDAALTALYEASAASPNRINQQIRDAMATEQEARAQLPRTTNNLVIIMSEIARGGMNQAVIGIEAARGRLAAALVRLDGATPDGVPTPAP